MPTILAAMFVQAITWWLDQVVPCLLARSPHNGQLAEAVINEANHWRRP